MYLILVNCCIIAPVQSNELSGSNWSLMDEVISVTVNLLWRQSHPHHVSSWCQLFCQIKSPLCIYWLCHTKTPPVISLRLNSERCGELSEKKPSTWPPSQDSHEQRACHVCLLSHTEPFSIRSYQANIISATHKLTFSRLRENCANAIF